MRPMKQDQKKNYELMTVKEAARYIGLAEKTRQIAYLAVRVEYFSTSQLNQ